MKRAHSSEIDDTRRGRRELLKAAIQRGIDSADRGQLIPLEEVLDRLEIKYRAKAARQQIGRMASLNLTERMRRIRKKDSKPELVVRRLVHGMGFRYRLHGSGLPGTPDIVLPRHRKVILVHGCFWHRHDCPDGTKLPRSKPEYWGPKLERNRRRDAVNVQRLRDMGWDVMVVWECELRNEENLVRLLTQFLR